MISRDFCFWLQGHLELTSDTAMSADKVAKVKAHLALVFKHEIDPSMGSPNVQAALSAIHSGGHPGDGLLRC